MNLVKGISTLLVLWGMSAQATPVLLGHIAPASGQASVAIQNPGTFDYFEFRNEGTGDISISTFQVMIGGSLYSISSGQGGQNSFDVPAHQGVATELCGQLPGPITQLNFDITGSTEVIEVYGDTNTSNCPVPPPSGN